MGNLNTSQINSVSDVDRVAGQAKAWCNIDQAGASIRSSFNIAGIVDNGAGDFTRNLTNIMSSTDYSYIPMVGASGAPSDVNAHGRSDFKTVSAYRIVTTGGTSPVDYPESGDSVFGDLA